MFSPRKRPIVREDSDSEEEEENIRAPTISPRKQPLVLDDSDSESAEVPPGSCKRLRRVVLDEDEEDDVKMPNASTDNQPASSPGYLPFELLGIVLENTNVANILDRRILCKEIRKTIDTHILIHHVQRVELIGYLGPKNDQLLEHLNAKDYWDFAFVRATFDCLDSKAKDKPAWSPQAAHFRISDTWFDAFERIGGEFRPGDAWWDHTRQCLDLEKTPSVYGQLRWCVKAGSAVLDFGIENEDVVDIELVENDCGDDDGNLSDRGISVRVTDWKVMLMNAFREEKALKFLLEGTIEDEYTYNHLEDSLRDMRRKRFRSKLDLEDRNDSRHLWKMDNMIPLWGKHTFASVNRDYDNVERVETNAVQTLMLLRREASMTARERAALDTIVVERAAMRKEMENVDQLFKKWHECLLNLSNLSLEHLHFDEDLDPNPMTWSQEVIDRERQSIARWKDQKHVIQQMTTFLDATNTVATLAEDAFEDDSDDDF